MTRITLLVVLASVLLAPAPAQAAPATKTDKAGDAPALVDITSFTVRNGADRVVMTSTVPGLRQRGGFAFGYSTSRFGGLLVFARRTGNGPPVEATYCGEVRCHDVHCPGLRVRWGSQRVTAIVPQRCYPSPLPSPGVFTATSANKVGFDDVGVLRVPRG
jgi:hypothetical protein